MPPNAAQASRSIERGRNAINTTTENHVDQKNSADGGSHGAYPNWSSRSSTSIAFALALSIPARAQPQPRESKREDSEAFSAVGAWETDCVGRQTSVDECALALGSVPTRCGPRFWTRRQNRAGYLPGWELPGRPVTNSVLGRHLLVRPGPKTDSRQHVSITEHIDQVQAG